MHLFSAIVLGIVQGLTEFLPVSSTAHLILFPWAFGWDDPLLNSLNFDVSLHLGTLIAVLIYFRKDWITLVSALSSSIRNRRISTPWERLVWLLVAATIPAGVLGLLFEEQVETVLRSPLLIVFTLSFVAVLMMAAEKAASRRTGLEMEKMSLGSAILIGFAQASALIPGVSRSGATITAGLWTGYRREAAARFSFLLSTPVIAGACLLKMDHLINGFRSGEGDVLCVGITASAVSGFLAIAFLIEYLKRHSLNVFAYYRFLLAGAVLVVYFVK